MSVQSQRNEFRNYGLAVLLAAGNYWFGYQIAVLNPLGNNMLVRMYGYSDEQKRQDTLGLLNNIFAIGALIGVLLAGGLANKIGRRSVMLLTDVLAIACSIGLLIINMPVFLFFRLISGMVSGLYSAIGAIILSESMPNTVCGFGNALGYTFVTFSILNAYLLPIMFDEMYLIANSNYFMSLTVIVPIIRLLTIPFMMKNDTAKYLFNKYEDKEIARRFMKRSLAEVYHPASLEEVVDRAIDTYSQENASGKVTFGKLFSEGYRTRLFSGILVCIAQQLSGINYLIFYSTELFKQSGKDKAMTLVVGMANVAGSLFALYAIRHFGRKVNIVWGVFAQAVGMFLLFIGYKLDSFWLLAIATIVYISAFAIGLGGSQMAYVSEILPPLGVSIACSVQWILTAIVAQIMLPANRILGVSAVMIIFTLLCIVFFFALNSTMIETKNKTESQIKTEFEQKNYAFMGFA